VLVALQPIVIVERPPSGPARGKVPVPPWLIVLVACAAVLAALGYGVWRLLRARKREL
jgi:hypothetical protein